MHAQKPELVVVDAGVGVLEVGASFAHRLDLGTREHDPGFPRVEDVVVVPRLAVGDDELVAAPAHRQHGTACSRTVREECPDARLRRFGWSRSRMLISSPRGTATRASTGAPTRSATTRRCARPRSAWPKWPRSPT